MITIPCIFCHKNNTPTVLQENGYLGKKCNSCNLIYISPRPSLEEIVNVYGHDQAHISASDHIAQEYPKKLHAIHSLNIIKKYIKTGDLLEIGSGAGYFLTQAQAAGFSAHGIELNPVQADFIRNIRKIPCIETPLNIDSFGTKTFDVIYHSDVLSHFYDPIQAMHNMHAKLKPGGYLIFETGNIADIDPKYYTVFNAMQYPDHLFFFGKKSLDNLLALTGFSVKKYYTYSILAQLRIIQMLKKIRSKKSDTPIAAPPFEEQIPSSRFATLVKTGYHRIMHAIRYQAGTYMPQHKKPQTIIVIAQKQ